jgi:hypothetical protein
LSAIGPGTRVRVKDTVQNEDEFDFVEDYRGLTGTVKHDSTECGHERLGWWCVTPDNLGYHVAFSSNELEVLA